MCVDRKENMETVKPYARLYGGPVFLRDTIPCQTDSYNINGSIPVNYVLDTAGVVVYAEQSWIETEIRAAIEALLPPTGIGEGKVEKPLSAMSVTPNPVTDRVLISFSLAKAGHASVRVYSSSGKLVRTVLDQTVSAGGSSATWDLRNDAGQRVTNGMYFYEVTAGSTVAQGKVSVLN